MKSGRDLGPDGLMGINEHGVNYIHQQKQPKQIFKNSKSRDESHKTF